MVPWLDNVNEKLTLRPSYEGERIRCWCPDCSRIIPQEDSAYIIPCILETDGILTDENGGQIIQCRAFPGSTEVKVGPYVER